MDPKTPVEEKKCNWKRWVGIALTVTGAIVLIKVLCGGKSSGCDDCCGMCCGNH